MFLLVATWVASILCGDLHGEVLKESIAAGGDKLTLVSVNPAPGTTLKAGEYVKMTIRYELSSVKAVKIWASPIKGERLRIHTSPSKTLAGPQGETTRRLTSAEPAEVTAIFVQMVETSDGVNGKELTSFELPLSYKWEGYAPKPKSDAANPSTGLSMRCAEPNDIGKPFPDLKFKSVDGRPVDVAALKGKVVLLDFWATWCGPCMAKMPALLDTYSKFHSQGLEVIGISLDKDLNSMKKHLADQKIEWPQYFDGKGSKNEVAERFHIKSIPCCILVDKKGIVRDPGPDLVKTIQELCAEAP